MENIEKIIFHEIGDYSYRLEEVKGLLPLHNVNGLIRVKGKYYKKVIKL